MHKFKFTKIKIVSTMAIAVACLFWSMFAFAPHANFEEGSISIETAVLQINQERYEGEIVSGSSVFSLMQRLQDEEKINFKYKNYSGIGKFIEEINGIKNDGDKYWIYYVNGREASVGVSSYILHDADVVEWKLK